MLIVSCQKRVITAIGKATKQRKPTRIKTDEKILQILQNGIHYYISAHYNEGYAIKSFIYVSYGRSGDLYSTFQILPCRKMVRP